MNPQFIIFLGINGSGKTTLYERLSGKYKGIDFINQDALVKSMGLDWRAVSSYAKIARITVGLLGEYFNNKKSIALETTQVPTRLIKSAKENGFDVIINYILIDDINICKKRITNRVIAGGHGANENYLQYSFNNQKNVLNDAIQNADYCDVYTNNNDFKLVAKYANGKNVQMLEK